MHSCLFVDQNVKGRLSKTFIFKKGGFGDDLIKIRCESGATMSDVNWHWFVVAFVSRETSSASRFIGACRSDRHYWDHYTYHTLNSLWPRYDKWRHRSRSTLAQAMPCWLTAPSHYLDQSWIIISKVQWLPFKEQFQKRYLSHLSLKLSLKITHRKKFIPISQGAMS